MVGQAGKNGDFICIKYSYDPFVFISRFSFCPSAPAPVDAKSHPRLARGFRNRSMHHPDFGFSNQQRSDMYSIGRYIC